VYLLSYIPYALFNPTPLAATGKSLATHHAHWISPQSSTTQPHNPHPPHNTLK